MLTKNNPSEVSISARVIKADGTIKDLGIVAYHNKSLIKRILYKLNKLAGSVK